MCTATWRNRRGALLRRTGPASLWRPRVLVSPVPHGSRTTNNRGARSVEVEAGVWLWRRMESCVDRRRRNVAVSSWRRRMEPAEDRCRWRRLGDGTRRRRLPCPVRGVGVGRGNEVPAGGMVGVPQGEEIPHIAIVRSGHDLGQVVDGAACSPDLVPGVRGCRGSSARGGLRRRMRRGASSGSHRRRREALLPARARGRGSGADALLRGGGAARMRYWGPAGADALLGGGNRRSLQLRR